MRRSVSTFATIAALLALYLGAPCLALARPHTTMPMDEPAASPCEAAGAGDLLCAAPALYVPPDTAPADLATPTIEPAPAALPAAAVVPALSEPAGTPASPAAPPAFLLHRALLI